MYAAKLSGTLTEQIPALNKRHAAVIAWEQSATPEQVRDATVKQLLGFELTQWPLPDLVLSAGSRQQAPLAKSRSEFRFRDVAQAVGIETQFHSGFSLVEDEFYIYQINGGGLASLDFDLDGRCDVYIVQAGGKPNDPIGSTPNQLFRQQSDVLFSDVTDVSGTGDRSYGQGVCAGDINQDGHIDLLIANIGVNILLINQGDGTFKQRNDLFSSPNENWTSSIGLGDLTGDHLPEIIEINYIDDSKAYDEPCDNNCHPALFHACVDHIYRGNRDGTFSPWQSFEKVNRSPKFGFGLVIANFDSCNGNDFFVSNDGDLNHFWASNNATDVSEDKFEVAESAGIRGCSVGRTGISQACMGIASGDFNRDGTLDLHVTNFFHEPVNLFVQNRSGFFSDEALKYRLFEPSFDMLGFGTQSADFDNDGWLDLAVLNGHVYKSHDPAIPFRMLPQLFEGSEQGFSLQDKALAGEYWQSPKLGRTLALLDWNRDGRVDLIGNHLDGPIVLLQNDTPSQSWLQVELVGVISERDAIGAEVRVNVDDEQWTSWQTGGDGYMCTNEPFVQFGLGNCQSIDRLQVRWPSGQTQEFTNIQTNRRLLAIEGESELFIR